MAYGNVDALVMGTSFLGSRGARAKAARDVNHVMESRIVIKILPCIGVAVGVRPEPFVTGV